jgi:hypothetical protein
VIEYRSAVSPCLAKSGRDSWNRRERPPALSRPKIATGARDRFTKYSFSKIRPRIREQCTTSPRILSVPRRFWRADFSPRGTLVPLGESEAEASRGLKPALRDLVAALLLSGGSALRCGGPSARPVQAPWEAAGRGTAHRKPQIRGRTYCGRVLRFRAYRRIKDFLRNVDALQSAASARCIG